MKGLQQEGERNKLRDEAKERDEKQRNLAAQQATNIVRQEQYQLDDIIITKRSRAGSQNSFSSDSFSTVDDSDLPLSRPIPPGSDFTRTTVTPTVRTGTYFTSQQPTNEEVATAYDSPGPYQWQQPSPTEQSATQTSKRRWENRMGKQVRSQ